LAIEFFGEKIKITPKRINDFNGIRFFMYFIRLITFSE
jgi:hypothetical protein